MLQNKQKGFTLIEILLSLGILALGLSGILTLFPVGLDAGQKAIQDTTSTIIAESLMDVLRASILQKHPDGNLPFVFDTLLTTIPRNVDNNNTNPKKINFTLFNANRHCGIGLPAYNEERDEYSLSQYNYRLRIDNSNLTQKHLYDVTITIFRNGREIRNFYSQIMIPDNYTN